MECKAKEVSKGAIVCVCNATYCDTIPSPEKIDEGQYVVYSSNKAGLRFNKVSGQFKNSREAAQITIKSNVTYQHIYGFGGAFTDATGINIRALSEKAQNNLLE